MQRKILRILPLLFILSITICSQLWIDNVSASPAKPGPIEVIQPNGVKFDAFMKGDEFQGWIEAANGYSIIENKDTGYWEYAVKDDSGQLVPSGIIVPLNLTPPQGIQPHLKPDRIVPVKPEVPVTGNAPYSTPVNKWAPHPEVGERKVIVVMVAFTDRALTTTPSTWDNIFFNTNTGVKSVANFYKDNSMSLVSITPVAHSQPSNPTGIIKVTLSRNHPNYGTNVGMNYLTEVSWVNEALALADDYVNFPSMDTDGSGILEQDEVGIFFIVAGYEAAGTYKTPSIGAHAFWGASGVTAGGKNLTRWGLCGELNHYNRNTALGCPTHELGHLIFNLSDLYDVNGVNNGIGVFSLMSGGSWGQASTDIDGGMTPTVLDAWSRQYLGWTTPRIPQEQGTVSFTPALSAVDTPVKLANPLVNTNEYFLIENRPTTGWDEGTYFSFYETTPGGLLILHIDESIGDTSMDNINGYVSGSHQGILVEEANTSYGSLMDPASTGTWGYRYHLFYQGNNSSWLYNTTPNSNYYNGIFSNMGITNVSAPAQVMTATVVPCPPVATPSFNPNGGTFTSPQDVTISCSTSGATIRYTINGSTPTESSTVYSGPVHIEANLTLKAKAWLSGIPASGIRVASYTFSDPPPANTSLTPNSGYFDIGTRYNLTSVYSHPKGYDNISRCDLLINKNLDNLNALVLRYNAVTDKLYILKDDKSAWIGGIIPGTDTIIENSQGKLYCKDVVVNRNGNNINISWVVELKTALSGNTCHAYMYVCDKQNLTDGWDKMGSFIVSRTPVNVSTSPSNITMTPESKFTLTSVYSDPDGNGNINRCDLLINKNLNNLNALVIRYNALSNKLYILKDDKSEWIGGITPGTDTILENSQGRLYCKDVIVTRTANDISIAWAIETKSIFAGSICYAYMYVCDKQNLTDGWDKMGTFIVGRPPQNVSLSPNNTTITTGSKYTLTSAYSDLDGRTDLSSFDLLINKNLDNLNALVLRYYTATNKLYILKDDKSAWIGGVAPGTDTILENTQGKLYCKDVVITSTAFGRNISWAIEIKPIFAGNTCYAYMYVSDKENLTDGWDKMGTFIIQ
ncbi:MAG: M6 family metalloprotease domain-containing protein [Armatimonadota bacterium]